MANTIILILLSFVPYIQFITIPILVFVIVGNIYDKLVSTDGNTE